MVKFPQSFDGLEKAKEFLEEIGVYEKVYHDTSGYDPMIIEQANKLWDRSGRQELDCDKKNYPPVLKKEKFWKEMFDKHPDEMTEFIEWVDSYKQRVEWDKIFNSNSDYQNAQGKNAVAPKLHELPTAMQIGIFIQFTIETEWKNDFIRGVDSMQLFINRVKEWFEFNHYEMAETIDSTDE